MRDYRIGETLGRLTVACIVIVCLVASVVVLAAAAGMLARVLVDCFMWGWSL